jgi:hypothetical protein
MRMRHIMLIGSASLALASSRFALADNSNPVAPAKPAAGQAQPTLHTMLNFTVPRMEGKFPDLAAHGSSEPALQQGKPAAQDPSHAGLHWTTVDSHPGIGYQIDKNEDLRLHFGGHGANASFALRF